jgi:hypothetical protein
MTKCISVSGNVLILQSYDIYEARHNSHLTAYLSVQKVMPFS